ncbi:hypothetical protein S83_056465 [Arachis hypogaea]
MSTTTTTTITNNPNSRTSSVDTPSPIIIHDYGANSSGDYLFQNCSQPKVTAGGGEGSAGGSGGSTNSIHHQHVLVKEVVKLIKRIKRWLKFVERGIEIRVRKMIIWSF